LAKEHKIRRLRWLTLDFHPTGNHFLQIPGPARCLTAFCAHSGLPTIDHRGPEFGALGLKLTQGIKRIFKTQHPVMIYPSSGNRRLGSRVGQPVQPGRSHRDV